ncbi:MAG: type IX secretion system membrane protein PorP/SprF [Tenuifilaceae bacterium]|jgi:type IX secretion system PorP/SprF family membrane protein|nr:type IX secretion system membrane protein PorP/SprF [Tenuifilaceae bacterium]
MKRIALTTIVAMLLLGSTAQAQQLPQFTQYMFNNYIINPAVGGTFNYYQIRYNNRFQWAGLNDAPQTYNISAYGPHGTKDMGFGGNFYYDVTGATSRTGGLFSYSYNMQITQNGLRISGGISLGFLMYRADGSKFELGDNFDPNDPALYTNTKSVFTPDANIGFLLYDTRFFFGISAHQLLGQKLYQSTLERQVGDDVQNYYGMNKLKQHFMVSGGVLLPLNRDLDIEPSALIKYMINSPVQIDLNAKVTYRKEFWGGLSFRWQDGISILFGYNYQRRYLFGYSFDYSLTGLRTHSAGSHEIMIGYMFDKLK